MTQERMSYHEACRQALEIVTIGACNPCGVSRTLHEIAKACLDKSRTTDSKHKDWAPYRLALSQLDYLAGMGYPGDDGDQICRDEDQCKKELGV